MPNFCKLYKVTHPEVEGCYYGYTFRDNIKKAASDVGYIRTGKSRRIKFMTICQIYDKELFIYEIIQTGLTVHKAVKELQKLNGDWNQSILETDIKSFKKYESLRKIEGPVIDSHKETMKIYGIINNLISGIENLHISQRV